MNVLFVHGTGVREIEYADTLRRIQAKLPYQKVLPCLWGDAVGARLHLGGLSIPEYEEQAPGAKPSVERIEAARWDLLYQDPLFELRLLEQRQGERENLPASSYQPGERAVEQARVLCIPPAFGERLRELGLEERWPESYRSVVEDSVFAELLTQANLDPLDTTRPIARALVAALLGPVTPAVTGGTREELVKMLVEPLGGQPAGVVEWGLGLLTRWAERNRRVLYDQHAYKAADTLYYQARGQKIRDHIRKRICDAGDEVVVLCHSLGGIAVVDLLIEKPMPQVRQLITVGSQAGFLYEMGALVSLPYPELLPESFPPWRNIYDTADFLSYRAEGAFPGRVGDFRVDNRQPFPQAHTAYWDNPEVIAEIGRRLR